MSEKHITQLFCDRCGDEFVRSGATTIQFGFMVIVNGSGSRCNATGRELDKDLCEFCTSEFKEWMKVRKP